MRSTKDYVMDWTHQRFPIDSFKLKPKPQQGGKVLNTKFDPKLHPSFTDWRGNKFYKAKL